MDETLTTAPAARCSPAFSMAGAMPAGSEMASWKTACPNPDTRISDGRCVGHGPSFSVAGVMPGRPETAWRTAMPNPTLDVLDGHGHVVTRIEAEARGEAQLASAERVLHLGGRRPRPLALGRPS